MLRSVLDGLTHVLDGRPVDEPVARTEVRTRTPRHASTPRVAEVLADLGLLHDDTTPAVRSWIDRRTSQLPVRFAEVIRTWLLVLLDGDTRARPRSPSTLYVYFAAVRPILTQWAVARGHLREITPADVAAVLDPLCGWRRRTAIAALRSLFRYAKKRGLIFANPTTRLRAEPLGSSLLPMTDVQIRAVTQIAGTPPLRLIIALAAIHAAGPGVIRNLMLDDLDLPNRRITLAGRTQRLDDLTHRVMRIWLDQRRALWPRTPNRHVLISQRTALGTDPVSQGYFAWHLQRQRRPPQRRKSRSRRRKRRCTAWRRSIAGSPNGWPRPPTRRARCGASSTPGSTRWKKKSSTPATSTPTTPPPSPLPSRDCWSNA
jgi:hypothetical protein